MNYLDDRATYGSVGAESVHTGLFSVCIMRCYLTSPHLLHNDCSVICAAHRLTVIRFSLAPSFCCDLGDSELKVRAEQAESQFDLKSGRLSETSSERAVVTITIGGGQ